MGLPELTLARSSGPSRAERLRAFAAAGGPLGQLPRGRTSASSLAGFGLALLLVGSENFLVGTLIAWALVTGLACLLVERARSHPERFVLDVLAGALLCSALLGLAWGAAPSALALLLAFLAERCCAAWAPPPVGRARRLEGAAGLLLDDWVGAAYSLGVLAAARALLPDLVWTA